MLLAVLLHLHVVGLIHLLLVEGGRCVVGRSNQDLLSEQLVLVLHLLLLIGWYGH